MKPRTLHLIILFLLCGVPALAGGVVAIIDSEKHSEFAPLGVALGLVIVAASALYAVISSLLVWKLAKSPRAVFAVHGGLLLTLALVFGRRFLSLVPQ